MHIREKYYLWMLFNKITSYRGGDKCVDRERLERVNVMQMLAIIIGEAFANTTHSHMGSTADNDDLISQLKVDRD
jgi:hypothetical protein